GGDFQHVGVTIPATDIIVVKADLSTNFTTSGTNRFALGIQNPTLLGGFPYPFLTVTFANSPIQTVAACGDASAVIDRPWYGPFFASLVVHGTGELTCYLYFDGGLFGYRIDSATCAENPCDLTLITEANLFPDNGN